MVMRGLIGEVEEDVVDKNASSDGEREKGESERERESRSSGWSAIQVW
jgi:hypothetical protein